MCVLIVDDNPKDLLLAAKVTREVGFRIIDSQQSIAGARAFLETALERGVRLPDAIVLDLSLGADSGYELLRMRYASPDLAKIRVIVWTEQDEHYKEVCSLFHADAFVSKWDGADGLRRIFSDLHLPVQAGPVPPGIPPAGSIAG